MGFIAGKVSTMIAGTALSMLTLGFLLGLKHAIETDHVAAVATIVSQQRSIWRSSVVGAVWGIGHTASLLIAGILVLGLKLVIPGRLAVFLELVVGVMLVGLGMAPLRRAGRSIRLHRHVHRHGQETHAHFHVHVGGDEAHQHRHLGLPTRSFWIGVVHGLAGSGAVTVLVLASAPSLVVGLGYILTFGTGSILGMLLVSTLIALPFALAARRLEILHLRIQQVAGLVSILVGAVLLRETLGAILG